MLHYYDSDIHQRTLQLALMGLAKRIKILQSTTPMGQKIVVKQYIDKLSQTNTIVNSFNFYKTDLEKIVSGYHLDFKAELIESNSNIGVICTMIANDVDPYKYFQ